LEIYCICTPEDLCSCGTPSVNMSQHDMCTVLQMELISQIIKYS